MTANTYYKQIFDNVASIKRGPEVLAGLKLQYASQIRSRRRLDSVKSIAQLLRVLEKRDIISPSKFEVLREIAEACGLSVTRVISDHSNSVHGYGAEPSEFLPVPRDLKDKIYQAIVVEIGQKWLYFARELGVRECDIDMLHSIQHTQNRIFRILRIHEERCDRRRWLTLLLDALSAARRNDLRQQVQSIYDTYPNRPVPFF